MVEEFNSIRCKPGYREAKGFQQRGGEFPPQGIFKGGLPAFFFSKTKKNPRRARSDDVRVPKSILALQNRDLDDSETSF